MRPDIPRWPFATAAAQVPPVQGQRRLAELRHSLGGIEQVCIVSVLAPQVLAPQLQPQVAGELPSAVAKAGWIDGFAGIALVVDHGA